MRVGIGYDIHALEKGRRLVLGGVRIPFDKGLTGHSDGDALYHAVIDAVLGAAGAGDIGEHFPDTDPQWKNADSRRFAKDALALLRKKRLLVSQIDAVILAERPSITPYKEQMRSHLAKDFGVVASRVNVKAKTHEGLGTIGKGQAIACHAVVLLDERQN